MADETEVTPIAVLFIGKFEEANVQFAVLSNGSVSVVDLDDGQQVMLDEDMLATILGATEAAMERARQVFQAGGVVYGEAHAA